MSFRDLFTKRSLNFSSITYSSPYEIPQSPKRNQLLISLVTIGLFASVIGVGTYTYFNDTETSTDNTMVAGVLDLWVNGQSTGSWFVSIGDMKPGIANLTAPLILRIVDNPGKICQKITDIVCDQGNQTPLEEAEENGVPRYDLASYTYFDLNVDGVEVIPDRQDTVAGRQNAWFCMDTVFPAVTDIPVIQSFHLMPSVTDWAQGDYCNITEEFMALQYNAPFPTS